MQNFFTACLVDLRPTLHLDTILLIIVLAHVKHLDESVVDASISESQAAKDQHHFFVWNDRLSCVVDPSPALHIVCVDALLAAVWWTNEVFISQICPALKTTILHHEVYFVLESLPVLWAPVIALVLALFDVPVLL